MNKSFKLLIVLGVFVFDEKRYRRTRRETAIHYLFGSRK